MKVDPIIAVENVRASSEWYQSIFSWRSIHGGDEFDILVAEDDNVSLCLHKWGDHQHPTLTDSHVNPGNGLILYFRTNDMDEIRARAKLREHPVEQEIELNPNSGKREFSLRDLDGYYLTISEYHEFEG